jgi:hypothetical protein
MRATLRRPRPGGRAAAYHSSRIKFEYLIINFLESETPAARFVPNFMRLWRKERDAQWAKKSDWSEPFDEHLQAALLGKKMTPEEFSRRWKELWGYSDLDVMFHEMIDRIFSACDDYHVGPGSDPSEEENRLRLFVAEAISSYFHSVTKREGAGSR